SDQLEGKIDARYARQELHWDTVSAIYLDVPYGAGIEKIFVEEFKRLGGRLAGEMPVTRHQSSFHDIIKKLPAQDFDTHGVYLVGYRAETVAFLRELRSPNNRNGSQIKILSTQPFNSLTIVKEANGAAENVIFSVPRPADSPNAEADRFRQAYKDVYHQDIQEEPADFSATAYDSLRLGAEAIKYRGGAASDIKAYLEEQKGFQGAAFGLVAFDRSGDINPNFVFKRVNKDRFE